MQRPAHQPLPYLLDAPHLFRVHRQLQLQLAAVLRRNQLAFARIMGVVPLVFLEDVGF